MPVTTIRGGRQITDGTIPYVDIQNVTANTILGNNTASGTSIQEIALSASNLLGRGTTGNIAPITVSTGLEFSGTVLQTTTNLRSLHGLTFASTSFVKMTGAGTFALDTNTYVGGNTGSVDNAVLRADGTGGSTVQNSSIILSDNADLTLGTTSLAGTTRTITVDGSSTNVGLTLESKGASGLLKLKSLFGVQVDGGVFSVLTATTSTNTTRYVAEFNNILTGTATTGLGVGLKLNIPTSAGIYHSAGQIETVWTNATNGSESSDIIFANRLTAVTAEKLRILSTGQLKLANYTSTSSFTGTAAGVLAFDSSGNILTIATPSGGSGITTLNTLTATTQTFATGTTGTDFGISSSTSTHTFNLPVASATNTGKLSSTDWTTFNNKLSAAITSLGGLTAATQTFANDTNVTITSATSTHTLGWTGQLAVSRGGTGASSLTGVLIGNGTSAVSAISSTTALQVFRVNSAGTGYEFATISSEASYWVSVPGTPTRSSNTVFTITDTSNTNKYDLLLSRKTVLKWTDTSVVKMAMVVSATYATNTVTVTIIGDVLNSTATMNTFRYAFQKADKVTFAVAGTTAIDINISRKFKADCALKIFGADVLHGTAGTTNSTTYDLNKNGTTMFSTKPSVSSGATVGNGFTANDATSLALDDVVTLDIDAISTTPAIDAYVDLFIFPINNQYYA